MNWLITIPKTIPWPIYQLELDAVADGTMALNYRLSFKPIQMKAGDRCYIVYDGQVRGWMIITDVVHHPDGFRCETTGAYWPQGWYMQRSGAFFAVENGERICGFRGLRAYPQVEAA